MPVTRRTTLSLGAGAACAAVLPGDARATGEDAIAAFTGGAQPTGDGVALSLPQTADSGYAVPVEISADGAVAILLVAPENPTPEVAVFRFGALSATARVATRIRLARSQTVVAVAGFADGSFAQATARVEVARGGCGV